jgi:hypothetical protein
MYSSPEEKVLAVAPAAVARKNQPLPPKLVSVFATVLDPLAEPVPLNVVSEYTPVVETPLNLILKLSEIEPALSVRTEYLTNKSVYVCGIEEKVTLEAVVANT